VRIEGVQDELFDLKTNPGEDRNIAKICQSKVEVLSTNLKTFITNALARRPDTWRENQSLNLNDEGVLQQLRTLGYIE
jgi:hypothetical protein